MDKDVAVMTGQEKETYWSRFAGDFEEKSAYVTGDDTMNAIRKKIGELNDLGRVLELGAGPGTYSETIASCSDSVRVTDFSDEMLAVVGRRFADRDDITVEKANCHQLTYDDSSFDTVILINLIHVIPCPEKALSEAGRVLRDGGNLVVVSFTNQGMSLINKIGMIFRYLKVWGKPPAWGTVLTTVKMALMLKNTGFSILENILLGDRIKVVFVRAQKK